MDVKKLRENRAVSNAAWLIAGRVLQTGINFILGILTARYLKPGNYGLLNYAAAYTGFFAAVCTLGINSVIVKEFIDHPRREGEIIGTALLLRAVSSFLSAILIMAIVSVVDRDEPLTMMVVALCTIGVLFNILETFKYWFQSKLESRVTATVTLAAHGITAAYKLYLIISGKSVLLFAAASSVEYIFAGLFLFLAYQRHKGGKLQFSASYAHDLLSKSAHYILPALMISVYGQTDKLMLKQMLSQADVGYYATAVSLCTGWCFVLNAIIESMQPGIIEAFRDGDDSRFQRKNRLLYAIVIWISFAVSLMFLLLGRPIVSLLYGKDYLPTVAPLRVITWYTAFSYLGVARNAWIVCENKQRYLIWIYLSAAVANIFLNLLLIPIWGTVGAAAASLAAQIVTTMVTPFFIKPLRENAWMMLDAFLLKGIKKKE